MKQTAKWEKEFAERFEVRFDELKQLYCEVYNHDLQAFYWLTGAMHEYYQKRNVSLKKLDRQREAAPFWYSTNRLVGMMLYVDNFADDLKGVKSKIDYIKETGVNYLHLMPLLKSPKDRSDGGYAVSDFRRVQPELGTMKDLEALTAECHKNDISVCLDFVMNHTSEDHVWAKAARAGDEEMKKRYFFFDNWDVPFEFERTVPQVFPTTAPGNFTQLENGEVVMTTFYPYQWDLNYGNCVVFNDMVCNMLSLCNRGIDIIRLDAVPYIWKELGTNCRNLPTVHKLVRMMRIISEIVCPSVLLLGEVVMEPSKVAPYFGTKEQPECHMLYNVTTMASTWHTLATKDVRLLRLQMLQLSELPKDYVFLNYLRCHDDIGWGLDYEYLSSLGMSEIPHKKFLNDYFTGKFEGSVSRGELYNDDESLGDARLCGTTASMCGIETALADKDRKALKKAIDCDVMLHAYMLTQSGIPVIYSGDEIAQLNDYGYHDIPDKKADSRYLHRGRLDWKAAEKRLDPKSVEGAVYQSLLQLESIRRQHEVFTASADFRVIDSINNHVLGVKREYQGEKLYAFFNFSEKEQPTYFDGILSGKDLVSGERIRGLSETLKPYGFLWILCDKK
ncbi:alpha-amylase family glycosyl hydrolase [Ruminococcus sp.]|uniref:alpha-amylase family glycosyl hydrolase n=1 Tax=Ruminococcus sp. TaxID=41978 RepID=UPI00386E24DD